MANEALVKKSIVAVKKESKFNTDPTISSTNVIRVAEINVNDEYEQIKWDEVVNTKDEMPALRGAESVSGDITINMRSCATEGAAPEGDVLYECALGSKSQSTASTCAASCTTTLIKVKAGDGSKFAVGDALAVIIPTATTYTTTSGSTTTVIKFANDPADFAIGDVVQVPNGAGTSLIEATQITAIDHSAKTITVSPALTGAPDSGVTVKKATIEVTWITSKSTDDLSISPTLSAAPDQYTDLRAGTFYKFTLNDLPSFWLTYWRGDVVEENYGGNKISQLEMDLTIGQIVKPKFTFGGVSCTKASGSYSLGSPTLTSGYPLVAMSQSIKIGGTTYNCDRFNLRITNEIYDDKDITSSGIKQKIHTGRKVEGSFSLLHRSLDIYEMFKNETTAEAVIIIGRNGFVTGQCVALRIPKMKFVKTPVGADNKLFKYDVSWEADIGTVGSEDTITSLAFL